MVRKILDIIIKVIAVVILLSGLAIIFYTNGQNDIAYRGCVDKGFHSGFATQNGVICVIHVDYSFDNKEALAPFSPPTS